MEVDAPEVTHVDGTLSMLNMSRIHSSKSVRGRWQVADFEWLYFVGQVCHGELNGSVFQELPSVITSITRKMPFVKRRVRNIHLRRVRAN